MSDGRGNVKALNITATSSTKSNSDAPQTVLAFKVHLPPRVRVLFYCIHQKKKSTSKGFKL